LRPGWSIVIPVAIKPIPFDPIRKDFGWLAANTLAEQESLLLELGVVFPSGFGESTVQVSE